MSIELHPNASDPLRTTPAVLTATGRTGLPASIDVGGTVYRHVCVFKNDFFAVTAMYESQGDRVLLKVHRSASFFGLPLRWIGRWLARREWAAFKQLSDVDGVPNPIARFGPTGIIREFVDGNPLQRGQCVPDEFHSRLRALIDTLHRRGMAYVDLEKCENVLVGTDGRPYLFDFQIAWLGSARWAANRWPLRAIRSRLQAGDLYHLAKLQRRTRPDQMTREALAASYRKPWYVRVHNRLTRPFTLTRRWLLNRVAPRQTPGERGRVATDKETDLPLAPVEEV